MEISRKIDKSTLMKLCKKFQQDVETEKRVREHTEKTLSRITKERNELNEKVARYDDAVMELNGLLNCILYSLMVQMNVDTLEIKRITYGDFKKLNKTVTARIDNENDKIILEMKRVRR